MGGAFLDVYRVCMHPYLILLGTVKGDQEKIPLQFPPGVKHFGTHQSDSTEHAGDFFCVSLAERKPRSQVTLNLRQLPPLGKTLPPEPLSGPVPGRPEHGNHLPGERRACGQSCSWWLSWRTQRAEQRKGRTVDAEDQSLPLHPSKMPDARKAAISGSRKPKET